MKTGRNDVIKCNRVTQQPFFFGTIGTIYCVILPKTKDLRNYYYSHPLSGGGRREGMFKKKYIKKIIYMYPLFFSLFYLCTKESA